MVKKTMSEEEKQKYLTAFETLYGASQIEKEAKYLGIILSFIDLSKYAQFANCLPYDKFLLLEEKQKAKMCGYVMEIGLQKSKKGNTYGLISIMDDQYNSLDIICGSKTFLEIDDTIKKGDLVVFSCTKSDNSKVFLEAIQGAKEYVNF